MLGVTVVSRSVPCGLYMISLMITSARAAGRIAASKSSNGAVRRKKQRGIHNSRRSGALPAAFKSVRPLLRVADDVVRIPREVRDVNFGVEIVRDELYGAVAHRVVAAAVVEAV